MLKFQIIRAILLIMTVVIVNSCTNTKVVSNPSNTVNTESEIILKTETGNIYGTILLPIETTTSIALIIAGSGPTDRDGNNPQMINNSLKMLAEALFKEGIASLRYDKRGIGQSKDAGIAEENIRFENFIDDAVGWINLIKDDGKFSKIIVIGHSEGSLIGMIAANQGNADAYISVAGAGTSADKIIKEQLKSQPQQVIDVTYPILDSLSNGEIVEDIPIYLFSLFRPSIQPYIISWMRYDPVLEIAKLNTQILIIQGTTDIQVTVVDAMMLSEANILSELQIIDGMNHIFKESVADRQENISTYNNHEMPIMKELVETIVEFITE